MVSYSIFCPNHKRCIGAKFGFSNKLPCSPTAIKCIKQNKTEFKRHVDHLKVALRERLVS